MARRKTKAQKANTRRYKERIARKDKRQPLTEIDVMACYFVELEAALVRQGYDKDKSRWVAQETIVEMWKELIPRWNENEDVFQPYDDDDEEDDF